MRFTIWRKGMILGTYPVRGQSVDDEDGALDALAKDEGHASFKAYCTTTGHTRDDHKVEKVEG